VGLGPRAHLLTCKNEGEGKTLQTVDSVDMGLTRTADKDEMCTSKGDRHDALFCFGATIDEMCTQVAF